MSFSHKCFSEKAFFSHKAAMPLWTYSGYFIAVKEPNEPKTSTIYLH
jgi:hypothetical protein